MTTIRTLFETTRTIHCKSCSTKKYANGSITYHHCVLTPVLASDCDKVIPLFPEFIQPQDGAEKQDCELNAAKRWLAANGEKLAQLGTLVGGDDLYSREPLCLQFIELKLDFIFVCKPIRMDALLDLMQQNFSRFKLGHGAKIGCGGCD